MTDWNGRQQNIFSSLSDTIPEFWKVLLVYNIHVVRNEMKSQLLTNIKFLFDSQILFKNRSLMILPLTWIRRVFVSATRARCVSIWVTASKATENVCSSLWNLER